MMPFEYHEPKSLQEAIELLAYHGGESALLAGGTALLVDMRHEELTPNHVISLWGLQGLDRIQLNGDTRLGTLVTVTQMVKELKDRSAFSGLCEAGLVLGGRQIQNVATVGGNICKASPGADLVPPLLCLDAQLELAGPGGDRATKLDGFLTGPDQTALLPAEILTRIRIPQPPPRTGTAFLKIMRRRAVDCSIVAVSARVTLAEDCQTFQQVRIGLGAVAPNPFRANRAERILQGHKLDPDLVRQAAFEAMKESTPITDVRATAEYRQMLIETLVERVVLKAAERAALEGRQT
jgi:CO/xanthine dehydrogenase FAD-binding subunit